MVRGLADIARRAARTSRIFRGALLCALGLTTACGGGDDGGDTLSCVSNLPDTCSPTFPATYDNLYTQVFQQRCGTSGGGISCHGSMGKKGGLDLSDRAMAYEQLLGATGRARVVPGDASCSILMERLESTVLTQRMPLGEAQLSEGVRCAVQTWIKNGAEQ